VSYGWVTNTTGFSYSWVTNSRRREHLPKEDVFRLPPKYPPSPPGEHGSSSGRTEVHQLKGSARAALLAFGTFHAMFSAERKILFSCGSCGREAADIGDVLRKVRSTFEMRFSRMKAWRIHRPDPVTSLPLKSSKAGQGQIPLSATRNSRTQSSLRVTPSPGRSGTVIKPSGSAWNRSRARSCRKGESSTQSSKRNADGAVASQ